MIASPVLIDRLNGTRPLVPAPAFRETAGHSPLVAGDVIALEPGLWVPGLGEMRLEDLLLVTEDGSETLTDYPYDLTPS